MLELSILIAGILLLVLLYAVLTFNHLITLKNRIENAWAQIDVQLKKRADLVPNLVETVKGYAKHEKTVFTEVTKARTAILNAKSVKEKAKADNFLTQTLKSLFAVAENYPKLEASKNFQMLQEELSGIENKIAYARQFYNDSVYELNKAIQSIPTNIIAALMNLKEKDYFRVEEEDTKPVKVKFE
ncbi:MAG: LemA family protein [Candidatus Anstonellales archaeon]